MSQFMSQKITAQSADSAAPRVRIYTPFFPYPPSEGAHQVVFHQILGLLEAGAQVELVTWKGDAAKFQRQKESPHLIPFPSSQVETLSLRAHSLGAHEDADQKEASQDENRLQKLQRLLRSFLSSLSSTELFHYPPLEKLKPSPLFNQPRADLAIYHYSFAYAWLRKPHRLPPENQRIVIFHNLESELAQARKRASSPPQAWIHELNARKLKAHEKALGLLADGIAFLSPKDYSIARYQGIQGRAFIQPPGFSEKLRQKRISTFRQMHNKRENPRLTLGFLGRMDFLPNLKAARWLIEELAPRLAENHFQGLLWLVGKGLAEELKQKAKAYSFIQMDHELDDLESFWRELSYCLVPNTEGSGVNIKLLEALASAIPVLAHPKAIERLPESVQAQPGLIKLEQLNEWSRFCLKAQAFKERLNLSSSEVMPESLSAQARAHSLLSFQKG